MKYMADQTFTKLDFTENLPEKADYENCIFNHCNFNQASLNGFNFENCTFSDCDFSLANVTNCAFRNVVFEACKCIGVQFDVCNPFLLELRFSNCQLNFASFFRLKMKETQFKKCLFHETDFTETNLNHAVFQECDFTGAMFAQTNLEYSDFETSENYIINPESNRIKGAKFSLSGLPGLLTKYNLEII